LALSPFAHKALTLYIEQVAISRVPHKSTIAQAVALTHGQRLEISALLSSFWGREIRCPAILDMKPQHGYQSRVLKDGFQPDQFLEWIVIGCSDTAEVSTDFRGRPNLVVHAVQDKYAVVYDVLIHPIDHRWLHPYRRRHPQGPSSQAKKNSPLG
jgi:hypothetical protein